MGGSGSGFAHHLVAEFFTDASSDSTGSERRINYDVDRPMRANPVGASRFSRAEDRAAPRDRNSPWVSSTRAPKQKSPEEIQAGKKPKLQKKRKLERKNLLV